MKKFLTAAAAAAIMLSASAGYAQDKSDMYVTGEGENMMVMGGGVNGRRVYARWPGLAPEQLVGPGDLADITGYAPLGTLNPNFSMTILDEERRPVAVAVADGATVIDTTGRTIDEVVDAVPHPARTRQAADTRTRERTRIFTGCLL